MMIKEESSQHWGFAGTLIWGVLVAILYMVVQTFTIIVYARFSYGSISDDVLAAMGTDATALSLATIATLFICGLAVCGAIKLKKNANVISYLAIHKIGAPEIRYWSLVTLAFIVASDALTFLLGRPIVPGFMADVYDSADYLWLLVLALVVAAPIFEELFFRGFLYAGLSASFVGPVGAIILSSLGWAAIHLQYDVYGMVTIFVGGLMLGFARLKTNSLFVPMVMHSIMNVVATIETIASATQ